MKKYLLGLAALVGATITLFTCMAADPVPPGIRNTLAKIAPGMEIKSVNASPVPGLQEIVVGAQIVYMTSDGRYLINGDMLDFKANTNLSEEKRSIARLEAIAGVDEDDMIVFAPDEVKYTIDVFTDIDCGYCRKLHREIDQYNALGIAVRYMAFPRTGKGSPSYNKAVSVWCADDRKKAITAAKANRKIAIKTCDNPVDEQYSLGEQLGVRGTPSIVLESGKLLPGYMEAAKMLLVLKEEAR